MILTGFFPPPINVSKVLCYFINELSNIGEVALFAEFLPFLLYFALRLKDDVIMYFCFLSYNVNWA